MIQPELINSMNSAFNNMNRNCIKIPDRAPADLSEKKIISKRNKTWHDDAVTLLTVEEAITQMFCWAFPSKLYLYTHKTPVSLD